VKHQTLQISGAGEASEAALADFSAEALVDREIAALGEWLTAQGLNLTADHPHRDEGSRDRLYWHYGYFVGLKNALAILTNRGATVH